jgi:hypothetical protein
MMIAGGRRRRADRLRVSIMHGSQAERQGTIDPQRVYAMQLKVSERQDRRREVVESRRIATE